MKRLILTVVMGLLCLGSEEVQGQNAPHLTFSQCPNVSRSIRGEVTGTLQTSMNNRCLEL